jgi:solute carrier family 8 (sodium/calcium exchanger)
VNVFLGLGMPWLIAACYWAAADCGAAGSPPLSSQCQEWQGRYAGAGVEDFGFVVMAGDLATSVVVFSVCAIITILTLVSERAGGRASH